MLYLKKKIGENEKNIFYYIFIFYKYILNKIKYKNCFVIKMKTNVVANHTYIYI